MRHAKKSRKFDRTSSHRQAMFRNLVTALLKNEHIETTEAKAKELRSWADRMITLGKKGDLHSRRQALAVVREKPVVKKLFEEIAPRFQDRPGGYTRLTKIGHRQGDAAAMAVIELVAKAPAKKPAKKETKKETKKEAKKEASPKASKTAK